ncbi:MAG: YgiT-type zinc finger protein [Chloroflexota bacterium]|nr:YgiT-type zinc finger protein [Chloroflexota bacterium]
MKCVICNSPDIEKKVVEEEIHLGQDVVLVPVEVLVCLRCGERYYDRRTMKFLEEMEDKIVARQITLHPVGQVLKAVN